VPDTSPTADDYIREGEYTDEINGTSISINVDSETEVKALKHTADSESAIISNMIERASEGDTIYDIGAHIGIHTCVLGTAVPQSTIVSFEPYPPNSAQLLKNVQKNDVDAFLVSMVVSDKSGYVTMSNFSDRVGTSTGAASLDDEENASSLVVPSVSCDQFVSESKFDPPDIVKIDVEGAEPLVLDGMEDTLSDDSCRALYCELHLPTENGSSIADYGATKDELLDTIREHGFSIEVLNERGTRVPTMHIEGIKD
jgi:FkbM family methyltransferase